MIKKLAVLMLVILMLGLPGLGRCSTVEDGWRAIEFRGGFSVIKKLEDFQQYEVLAIYGLPWEWRMDSGWGVAPQFNFTAGLLRGGGTNGFIGGVGPSIVFNKANKGIEFELGINLDASDKKNYGMQNLGSNVFFGVFVGIGYQFENSFGIGYQLQHFSNGHIFYGSSTPNPGIDNHLFLITWFL
ncbi:MAG TPA: acyloxyacyl hydrolase [Desulfuromonadaceae bacterium]|jgi:hypothetical protein